MRRSIFDVLGAVLFIAVLLIAWQLVAQARLVSPIFFPEPLRVADSIWRQITLGSIWGPLAATSVRMLGGWCAAMGIGILLGAAIGLSRSASQLLASTLEFLRTLPASAVLPIFILMMGLTDGMIVAVIAFGSLWPVLLSTVHGFRTLEPRLNEVARNLELRPVESFRKITLPNAMPDILAGARVGIAFALILAIVAEMLSSKPGLGNNILLASRSFRSADLYAGIVVLALLGALTSGLLALVEARLLRWRPSADQ
jgi:ABC-type nitrate/sulfonate/bicarbonate transport system permease component